MPALRIAAVAMGLIATGSDRAVPGPREVLAAINVVRLNPSRYGDWLVGRAAAYRGTIWAEQDGIEHNSLEGADAVLGAAAALRAAPATASLTDDPVLAAAARAHVAAQGPTGMIGHASAAGLTPGMRVRAAGGDVYVAEVIAYGMHEAADVVRELIVDDGLPDRGHRRLLLAAAYRYAGIACGSHASQGTMCVVDLAAAPGGRAVLPTR